MDTHCTAQEDIGEDDGFLDVHVVAQDEFNGKELEGWSPNQMIYMEKKVVIWRSLVMS